MRSLTHLPRFRSEIPSATRLWGRNLWSENKSHRVPMIDPLRLAGVEVLVDGRPVGKRGPWNALASVNCPNSRFGSIAVADDLSKVPETRANGASSKFLTSAHVCSFGNLWPDTSKFGRQSCPKLSFRTARQWGEAALRTLVTPPSEFRPFLSAPCASPALSQKSPIFDPNPRERISYRPCENSTARQA